MHTGSSHKESVNCFSKGKTHYILCCTPVMGAPVFKGLCPLAPGIRKEKIGPNPTTSSDRHLQRNSFLIPRDSPIVINVFIKKMLIKNLYLFIYLFIYSFCIKRTNSSNKHGQHDGLVSFCTCILSYTSFKL